MLSVSHSYVETLVQARPKAGKLLKKLKDRIDRPLAAILTLNTIANTIGAAGVGAQALKLANRTWPDSNNGKWVALASGLLTLAILVCSEIIPKTLGAIYHRRLSPLAAYAINGLIKITYPIVVSSEALAKLIARNSTTYGISREEMIASAELGAHAGEIDKQEIRIIRNLLRLNTVRAKDVMTPRSVLFALKQRLTVGEVVRNHSPIRYSRLPIFQKDMDHITGFVLRHDVLQSYSKGDINTILKKLRKPIHAIPYTKSVALVLEEFIHLGEQIFLVVDEYGGTAGIITLEDAIETLLGVEIVDELDSVADMRKLAKHLLEKRRAEMNLQDENVNNSAVPPDQPQNPAQ